MQTRTLLTTCVTLASLVSCVIRDDLQDHPTQFTPSNENAQNSETLLSSALAGLREDEATAKVAMMRLVEIGEPAIPELRKLTEDPNIYVQARARDVLGQITGQWGGGVGLLWKRSVAEAKNEDKPLLVLHLFGDFDKESC